MAMRVSLKELIQSSIVLQYHLPHDIADKHISCSCISTEKDYCLHQNGTNIDIANIIYNGIVESLIFQVLNLYVKLSVQLSKMTIYVFM